MNDNYQPYGPEWVKELFGFPKIFLINWFKNKCIECKILEEQNAALTAQLEAKMIEIDQLRLQIQK